MEAATARGVLLAVMLGLLAAIGSAATASARVENGSAPRAVTFPVTGSARSLRVEPFNPLERAPRNNGLNSNYRYIGVRSAYRPGQELWCEAQGRRLVCRGAARARP